MKKNINKLTKKERESICLKHFKKNFYNTCEGCPLEIDPVHCYNGTIDAIKKTRYELKYLKELLKKVKDKEVEVLNNE